MTRIRTFVRKGMASPQVENGYTRIANELLEALCRARLGSREFRVVLAVVRLTYGFQRKEAAISLGMLEKITKLRRERLLEVVRALERKNILCVRKENNRLILRLQKDYTKWVSQKRVSQNWVSQNWGAPKMGHPVPQNWDTPSPETVEPQAFYAPLKKNIKENTIKKSSSIYRDDDQKEVIRRWEEVFGEAFPLERASESVRAADFMLYLYEAGRLPAVKRPSAYLRKLAASELEPFPSLSERRAQARAAEERLRELDRRELARLYARMVAEGWPVEIPEEVRPLVAGTQ